jgi:hypothetical protein
MRHVAHRHWIGDLVRGPIFRKFPELLASSDSGPAPPPARTGGRRARGEKDAFLTEFQSTPPRGGRREVHDHHALGRVVSIHAPTGGGDTPGLSSGSGIKGFNPRPHGGGTSRASATWCAARRFNPRPHGGGDALARGSLGTSLRFNPRPHGGGDKRVGQGGAGDDGVSIHAPTGGATMDLPSLAGVSGSFNPRPHGGGDPPAVFHRAVNSSFQSTPPRGGRRGFGFGQDRAE